MTNQLIEHKGKISTNWISSPTFKPDFPPLPAVLSYLQFTMPVHQFCKFAWGFLPSSDQTTQIIDGEFHSGLAEIRICC